MRPGLLFLLPGGLRLHRTGVFVAGPEIKRDRDETLDGEGPTRNVRFPARRGGLVPSGRRRHARVAQW